MPIYKLFFSPLLLATTLCLLSISPLSPVFAAGKEQFDFLYTEPQPSAAAQHPLESAPDSSMPIAGPISTTAVENENATQARNCYTMLLRKQEDNLNTLLAGDVIHKGLSGIQAAVKNIQESINKDLPGDLPGDTELKKEAARVLARAMDARPQLNEIRMTKTITEIRKTLANAKSLVPPANAQLSPKQLQELEILQKEFDDFIRQYQASPAAQP